MGAVGSPTPSVAGCDCRRPTIWPPRTQLRAKATVLNTTIGVVATDATLSKAACRRVAVAGHDGLARAIRPAHSPLDGDTIFALATGARDVPAPGRRVPAAFPTELPILDAVCTAAAACVSSGRSSTRSCRPRGRRDPELPRRVSVGVRALPARPRGSLDRPSGPIERSTSVRSDVVTTGSELRTRPAPCPAPAVAAGGR